MLYSLPVRSLQFYWRGNLAVLLGVALAAAVLSGALFVGDSLRGSLLDRAERQRGGVNASWAGSRLIRAAVAERLPDVIPALLIKGSLAFERPAGNGGGGTVRQPNVTVIGLNGTGAKRFSLPTTVNWDSSDSVAILGHGLAKRMGVQKGEKLRLSVQHYSSVPRSSLLGKRSLDDTTSTLAITVAEVLPEGDPANDFALFPSPELPLTIYLPLGFLQDRQKQSGKINALLYYGNDVSGVNKQLQRALNLEDLGLRVKVAPKLKSYVSVESEQLVLDPASVDAALEASRALGLRAELTSVYLANDIAHGKLVIPYSVVAGLDPAAKAPLGPMLPEGGLPTPLKDDEILLADWKESPLKDVPLGSEIKLVFFKPEIETGAEETSATFKLVGRVPLAGAAADPDLTPPFPGITDKLTIGEWNPSFPFDNSRIKPRDQNERYWDKYKTTPKAYISLFAARRLFTSRFGLLTSIRVAPAAGETPAQAAERLAEKIQTQLSPEKLGIAFEDTQARLKSASQGGTDFGGLFLGFSLFLIVSSLMLISLLFRLNIEKRAKEIGTLLAVGYTTQLLRRLLMIEGIILALIGSLVGIGLGAVYSQFLLGVLTALWPDTSVQTYLRPHYTALSAVMAYSLTILMTIIAIRLALRELVRIPAPMLLRGVVTDNDPYLETRPSRWSAILIVTSLVLAAGAIVGGTQTTNPDFRAMGFFMGGGLLLTAGSLMIRRWLRTNRGIPSDRGWWCLFRLGPRNASRYPGRSLMTVLLLGCATFLLVAVESFRRKPDSDFDDKNGGSGGYRLIAESNVPVQSFETGPGRDDLLDSLQKAYQQNPSPTVGIDDRLKEAGRVIDSMGELAPVRVRGGDDASCLNLYQAANPRLLGMPQKLMKRGGFKFYATEAKTNEEKANPWILLQKKRDDGAIPVFAEQNTAMYMLKVGLGGEVVMPNEAGEKVRFRIVATVVDSPFQSELLVDEAEFTRLYPHEEGYKMFLIEAPSNPDAIVQLLQAGFQYQGMSVTSIRDRVAGFQAVIGTYLTTFQLLGGLGLLFGVLGLGVIILRGIWERAGELALLRAFGYRAIHLHALLLGENAVLLALGVGLGLLSALISVAPHLLLGGQWPWQGVAILIVAVIVMASIVILLATRSVNRIPMLSSLRNN